MTTCLKLDRKDPTYLHVEIDAMIGFLAEFGCHVPPAQFQKLVSEYMREHVLHLELGQPNMMSLIALGIVQLAEGLILFAEKSSRTNEYSMTPEIRETIEGDKEPETD